MNASGNIKKIAKRILKDGLVDAVVGFQKASLPGMSQPFIARTKKDAEKLIFDNTCRMNLVAYLPGLTKKIGIVVKGCDSRNLVTLIMENKIKRKELYIIGVPCTGVLDKKSNVLQENCNTCIQRNPVIFDELAGPEVEELDIKDRFRDVKAIEAMAPAGKQDFFDNTLKECTRCYACRNACPLCYCPVCFVDESRPQWVGKTTDPIDVKTYHLLRAFHNAGRCTDCGACEAACPSGIKMRIFTRKTIKDCVDNYGWETGMDNEQRPALDQFMVNDPQSFIQ